MYLLLIGPIIKGDKYLTRLSFERVKNYQITNIGGSFMKNIRLKYV